MHSPTCCYLKYNAENGLWNFGSLLWTIGCTTVLLRRTTWTLRDVSRVCAISLVGTAGWVTVNGFPRYMDGYRPDDSPINFYVGVFFLSAISLGAFPMTAGWAWSPFLVPLLYVSIVGAWVGIWGSPIVLFYEIALLHTFLLLQVRP